MQPVGHASNKTAMPILRFGQDANLRLECPEMSRRLILPVFSVTLDSNRGDKMSMTDPKHPIWSIVRLTVMMTALTTILYLTASKFDATELRTIVMTFVAGLGIEGGIRAIQGNK